MVHEEARAVCPNPEAAKKRLIRSPSSM